MEDKVFYLCDGNVPDCSKTNCYKQIDGSLFTCRHTSDVSHAINFKKTRDGRYMEKKKRRLGGKKGENISTK